VGKAVAEERIKESTRAAMLASQGMERAQVALHTQQAVVAVNQGAMEALARDICTGKKKCDDKGTQLAEAPANVEELTRQLKEEEDEVEKQAVVGNEIQLQLGAKTRLVAQLRTECAVMMGEMAELREQLGMVT
jgi:chromosome segregation ATPase